MLCVPWWMTTRRCLSLMCGLLQHRTMRKNSTGNEWPSSWCGVWPWPWLINIYSWCPHMYINAIGLFSFWGQNLLSFFSWNYKQGNAKQLFKCTCFVYHMVYRCKWNGFHAKERSDFITGSGRDKWCNLHYLRVSSSVAFWLAQFSIQHFHKQTMLALMALMPTLYSHIFAVFFIILILRCSTINVKFNVSW